MLFNKISSYLSSFLYLSNFFIKIENNNLKFNKFIKNYKVIIHKLKQDNYNKCNNTKDFLSF